MRVSMPAWAVWESISRKQKGTPVSSCRKRWCRMASGPQEKQERAQTWKPGWRREYSTADMTRWVNPHTLRSSAGGSKGSPSPGTTVNPRLAILRETERFTSGA